MVLYTVGYAHWTISALARRADVLDAAVIDIRMSPYSRRVEWRREVLERTLGQRYHWCPALGNTNYNTNGPIEIADYRAGFKAIEMYLQQYPCLILMCGCANYEACHRAVVADRLHIAGYDTEELHPDATEKKYKALTLTQPWASLVAWGEKRIETRSWGTRFRGPLAIHAAKSFPVIARATAFGEPFRSVLVTHGVQRLRDLPLGSVIATGELVGCQVITASFAATLTDQERAFGNFTPGRYAWQLDHIVPLPEPVPARGMLGLWGWAPCHPTIHHGAATIEQARAWRGRDGRSAGP